MILTLSYKKVTELTIISYVFKAFEYQSKHSSF